MSDNRPPISNWFCRPARPSWEGRGQRSRCLLGDYFLTEPPPELYSAAAREQAKVAWKRRNQERKEAEAQRRLNAQNWEVQLWGAALPRDALQPEGTASVLGAACGAPVRGILRKRGAKRNRPVRQLTFKDGSSKYTPYENSCHCSRIDAVEPLIARTLGAKHTQRVQICSESLLVCTFRLSVVTS